MEFLRAQLLDHWSSVGYHDANFACGVTQELGYRVWLWITSRMKQLYLISTLVFPHLTFLTCFFYKHCVFCLFFFNFRDWMICAIPQKYLCWMCWIHLTWKSQVLMGSVSSVYTRARLYSHAHTHTVLMFVHNNKRNNEKLKPHMLFMCAGH